MDEKKYFIFDILPEPGMTVEAAIWSAAHIAYNLACVVRFTIGFETFKIHPLDNPDELVKAWKRDKEEKNISILREAVRDEIDRNYQLIEAYKKIPTGTFARMAILQDIKGAELIANNATAPAADLNLVLETLSKNK